MGTPFGLRVSMRLEYPGVLCSFWAEGLLFMRHTRVAHHFHHTSDHPFQQNQGLGE